MEPRGQDFFHLAGEMGRCISCCPGATRNGKFCYAPGMVVPMPIRILAMAPLTAVLSAAPTFTRDVAPILYERCVQCHRPNSIAPMSLLDYKSTRPWARSIREAVLSRKMPPWFADPQYGHFANDARLNARQLETIKAWVDGGSVEGDPKDMPKAPEFADGWRLGKPDII